MTPSRLGKLSGALQERLLVLVYAWSLPAVAASLFFAVSLAPSMLPRPAAIQGILSGLSLSAGYGLGALATWFWHYLQLPVPRAKWRSRLVCISAVFCAYIVLFFLWQAAGWQNTLRDLMGMEPAAPSSPFRLAAISGLVFGVMTLVARLFRRVFKTFSACFHRALPPRIAHATGLLATLLLFWTTLNGVLVRTVLRIADRSFQEIDARIEPDTAPPPHFAATGEADGLRRWQLLGRQGRRFVSSGPTAEDLDAFFGEPTPSPVRVYVGLNTATTAKERADHALRELIQYGGFERSILVLATPTGTGWLDPGAVDTLEYLHRGDTAIVAAQYSYLNSPLALLTEADYGKEMARELFNAIHGHWRTLPRETRPRLFLHGLSLGAFHSDHSFNLFDIMDAPFDGALWSGPPFRTATWHNATANRAPGSPAWLPVFREGTVVRFATQAGVQPLESEWGRFRLVFLQYASDPITFFEPAMLWSKPAWLREPRAPDVSPNLRWFPVVTGLQVLADMVFGASPSGFGHEIAPEDYLSTWRALTEPAGWSEAELARLRLLVK